MRGIVIILSVHWWKLYINYKYQLKKANVFDYLKKKKEKFEFSLFQIVEYKAEATNIKIQSDQGVDLKLCLKRFIKQWRHSTE